MHAQGQQRHALSDVIHLLLTALNKPINQGQAVVATS